jgi:hypothetical protein
MDTQAHNPTHTYPHTFNGDTDDSQFAEPWDPTRDDLTMIVNIGYSELSSTSKWTYNLIYDLVRGGEAKITAKTLTDIQNHSNRSTYYALEDLEKSKLISRNSRGEITLLEPNARNKDYRAYITSTL